jgi:hypothetical protein
MMRVCVLLMVVGLAACAPLQGTREPMRPAPEPSTPDRPGEPGRAPWPDTRGPTTVPEEPGLPAEESYPRRAADVSGPAVTSLVNQAEQEMSAGRPDAAVAVLERAMRIEPRNPFVWAALAEGYLATDNAAQAETVAARANSYARGNPWLEARNWRTVALAREAQGNDAGAGEARERLRAAQNRQPPV